MTVTLVVKFKFRPMKKCTMLFSLISLVILLTSCGKDEKSILMWYTSPAENFDEALPLGNGRLGVMVYGGVEKEKFNINEETLWGGGPAKSVSKPELSQHLQKVRAELFAEKWQDASRTLRNLQGANANSYVPLADLHLEQDVKGEVTDYVRTLDLATAVATTSFVVDGVKYERKIFVSKPADIIIIRLTASEEGKLNFSLFGDTQFEGANVENIGQNEFVLNGQLPYRIDTNRRIPLQEVSEEGERGMRYQLRVRAVDMSGNSNIVTDEKLNVLGATDVLLYVSAATSYNGYDKRPDTEGADESKLSADYLGAAVKLDYTKLLKDHIADYQTFFNRVKLDLGETDEAIKQLPTDERLKKYKEGGKDPEFETLYFDFGRYLLICSSRPGGIPANLQGIWNDKQRPSWGSEFTTNINVQMNYWPAAMLNLLDMEEPLLDQIERWAVNGEQVARDYYNMGGWTVHHNSDIWAVANPVQGDPKYANWALGSPWLCQHLFWHYQFTMDKEYLKNRAYPLMKGAAEFCDDWLVLKDGYYVTAPSTSPENVFIDNHGNKGVVTIASTMDMQIIWDLYNNLIEVSEVLGVDDELRKNWVERRDKLFPMRIGKAGNLMEWYGDWEDEDPEHRHVSHLFGLHPGRQISPLENMDLAQAAIKTLEVRGDGGTGWSKAWKINFWARLLDGDHAYKMYRELLTTSTLINLFDTHPPFQIDGNFGSIAGVVEMLLQSHMNELHLLPALPKEWRAGSIGQMLARGGYAVSMEWHDNSLYKATVTSKIDNKCVIRTDVPIQIKNMETETVREGKYYITSFDAKKGNKYEIVKI